MHSTPGVLSVAFMDSDSMLAVLNNDSNLNIEKKLHLDVQVQVCRKSYMLKRGHSERKSGNMFKVFTSFQYVFIVRFVMPDHHHLLLHLLNCSQSL